MKNKDRLLLIKSMLEALRTVQEKLVDLALTLRIATNQIEELTNDMEEEEENKDDKD